MRPVIVLDCESYPNFLLISVLREDGKIARFSARGEKSTIRLSDRTRLLSLIQRSDVVAHNGRFYDAWIVVAAILEKTAGECFEITQAIIEQDMPSWQVREKFELPDFRLPIDTLQIVGGGLKKHSANFGMSIEELPIPPGTHLTPEQMDRVTAYCDNDLHVTRALYDTAKPAVVMREELGKVYGADFRDQSDSQIGEAVIRSEYRRLTNKDPLELKRTKPLTLTWGIDWPAHLSQHPHPTVREVVAGFDSDTLRAVSGWDEKTKTPTLRYAPHAWLSSEKASSKAIGRAVYLADKTFALGWGGVHSVDAPGILRSTKSHVIIDLDVASFYPSIQILHKLRPEHLGDAYTEILTSLTERRLNAKRANRKAEADGLKIVINSLYGRGKYTGSVLNDPKVASRTTILGQVSLLALIAEVELAGIDAQPISANTDGVTFFVARADLEELRNTYRNWERSTGFVLEEVEYTFIARKDVNNYIALTADGKQKGKGVFVTEPNARQALHSPVIAQAVIAQLTGKDSIEHFIHDTDTLLSFCEVMTATSRFEQGGIPCGKTIRAYRSHDETQPLIRKAGGKQTSDQTMSGSFRLVQHDIRDATVPEDLDRDYYVRAARELLLTVSTPLVTGRNRQAKALAEKHDITLFPKRIAKEGHADVSISSRFAFEGERVKVWDYSGSAALAVKTGPEVGIIVLDFDKVSDRSEPLDPAVTRAMQQNPGMVVWHGPASAESAESVLAGTHDGKVVYRFSDPAWPSTAAVWRRVKSITGIEVGYANTIVMNVAGLHPSGSTYRRQGTPVPLPDAIKTFLFRSLTRAEQKFVSRARVLNSTYTATSTKRSTAPQVEAGGMGAMREVLAAQIDSRLALLTPDVRDLGDESAVPVLIGPCPGNHVKGGALDLMITASGSARCFHASCSFVAARGRDVRRVVLSSLEFNTADPQIDGMLERLAAELGINQQGVLL